MLLLSIFLFLIIAVLIILATKRREIIEGISLLSSGFSFFLALFLAFKISSQGEISAFSFFTLNAPGAILLLITTTIAFTATLYSVRYFREETKKDIIGPSRVRQYFLLTHIFFIAVFCAITSNNPIFTWISLEATTLSTAFLISFYNKPSAIEAAWKYLIINSVGLLLGFFGTLLFLTALGNQEGTHLATWNDLLQNAGNLDPTIAKIAFIFVLIGYGTKMGLAPLHTWKPDAYSKSPAPLGAFFSGVILPVAFFTLLKFRILTNSVVDPGFTEHLFLFFGLFSIAVASFILLTTRNYKRLLAYSGIEHAGIMLLGIAFGGIGIFIALLHTLFHSLIKSALFFLSGNFLLRYHSAKIKNVSGALIALPITGTLFILGFLAITGTPPFGMFLTKLTILSAGAQIHPIITFFALLFMAVLFIGFLRHLLHILFGKKPENITAEKENIWLLIPPITLLLLVVILGFYLPPFLSDLLTASVEYYR